MDYVDDRVVDQDEDWGQHALQYEPGADDKAQALAPSELAAAAKWDHRFNKDSADVVWKVYWKRPDNGVSKVHPDPRGIFPSGFPSLMSFFEKSKSLRVFQWGFRKYVELYPEDPWTAFSMEIGLYRGKTAAQRLRLGIFSFMDALDAPESKLKLRSEQKEVLFWLDSQGFFTNCLGGPGVPSKLRALIHWNRASHKGRLLVRFPRQWRRASTEKKDAIKEAKRKSVQDRLVAMRASQESSFTQTGSPSLKRSKSDDDEEVPEDFELFGDEDDDLDKGSLAVCNSPSLKKQRV